MLNPKMQDALNRQINAELFSSYLYLSMSAYFESVGLEGMAGWMRAQAAEEEVHAMKMFAFINERDGRVLLDAIDKPKSEWNSPLEVFQEAYQHEQKVTALINGLVDLAETEKDHASVNFLQWFVNEQVEEESTARGICDRLKLVGDHGPALLMMDAQLGGRAAPAAAESA
ncbi:MAG: ferritin [Thermoguttaceae bacterium]|jgi:ferritin|nr:ferritin [Thermoguttaceae bacterium]